MFTETEFKRRCIMAKKRVVLLLCVVFTLFVVGWSVSTLAAESQKEFTINVLAAPIGSGDITTEMGIAQLLKQKNS